MLGAIVELDSSELEELAQLLKTAQLSSIIKTIKLLEDRFLVINELKDLVFNRELGADEAAVQQFIESHYWIFGEQYHLVTAEEPKFEEALRRYIYLLRGEKAEVHIDHPDKYKEMDIFAVRRDIQNDMVEHIVVELKHPRVKLGAEHLEQVKTYMRLIMKQDVFNGSNLVWHFYLVGNSFDSSGAIENEFVNAAHHGEKHLAFKANNYKIYVKRWSEICAEFDTRHNYLYKQLQIERGRLITAHANADQIVEKVKANSAVQPAEVKIPA